MRISAISIPSKIADGASSKGTNEFIYFLYIALGSTAELQTQLKIAKNLGYDADYSLAEDKIIRIKKMLHGLIGYSRKG